MLELVAKLRVDYPELRFINGKKFSFKFPNTIKICYDEPCADLLLLHELGHAILGHKNFATDIERLKMETEAWDKARQLAEQYDICYDETVVQAELDSYRDWLHKKSRCPVCGLTRFQDANGYHCPRCENLD